MTNIKQHKYVDTSRCFVHSRGQSEDYYNCLCRHSGDGDDSGFLRPGERHDPDMCAEQGGACEQNIDKEIYHVYG